MTGLLSQMKTVINQIDTISFAEAFTPWLTSSWVKGEPYFLVFFHVWEESFDLTAAYIVAVGSRCKPPPDIWPSSLPRRMTDKIVLMDKLIR